MSALLAIDAGNSRFKWALHDGADWLAEGAISITDALAAETLSRQWQALTVDAVLAANVAGVGVGDAIAAALKDRPVRFISAMDVECGVHNGYQHPATLGADRWAALIGAHHLAPSACARLVVMAGTALTIDALTGEGQFLGGTIMPGPRLMRESLKRGTANLPFADGRVVAFPQTTEDAIQSGIVAACVGSIERMAAQLAKTTGTTPFCIGAGGALDEFTHALSLPLTIQHNLVLEGLLKIHQDNSTIRNQH